MLADKSYGLDKFLKHYNLSFQNLSTELRSWVIETAYPPCEIWYNTGNAFSVAFSLTDRLDSVFCHIAITFATSLYIIADSIQDMYAYIRGIFRREAANTFARSKFIGKMIFRMMPGTIYYGNEIQYSERLE